MKNILVHGLGQNDKDWNIVIKELSAKGIFSIAPDLFGFSKDQALDYNTLYHSFNRQCTSYGDQLNLCGLSLGGLLALNYALEHPQSINSLVLIGTPFEIPKVLLALQNLLFHLMPKTAFKNLGVAKKDFIRLSTSVAKLDFMKSAALLKCPALILCGANDKANLKSAGRFHEAIKKSELVIIKEAGHEVNIDKPIELADVLGAFWKQHSGLSL